MARPLRIEFSGALYHVTSRGNRRERIFETDRDRVIFLEIFGRVVDRFKWVCHTYCLMDNHYHLLIETPGANLSKGMRQLNGVYTQRFNASHEKSGHVFQGRFNAVLIEKEAHLLEVSRYVALNPVRAGMVERPQQWKWSSYKATAGLVAPQKFLCTDWLLHQFGRKRREAQKGYRRFVREGGEAPTLLDNLTAGFILGGKEFVATCREALGQDVDLQDFARVEQHIDRPTLEKIFVGRRPGDRAERNRRIFCAHVEHGYTQKAISNFCDLHYGTVSRIIKKLDASDKSKRSKYKT